MYNSLIVSISVRMWKWILHGYEDSSIKKIVDWVNKFISYLLKGSIVRGIFKSEKELIKESSFYKISSNIIEFISRILNGINKYIKKIGEESLVYRSINSLFLDGFAILGSLFVFLLALGIGLIGNNLARGFYSGQSYIVGAMLIVTSLIGLGLRENYREITGNSWICNFIISIFTIDEEGGDKWW